MYPELFLGDDRKDRIDMPLMYSWCKSNLPLEHFEFVNGATPVAPLGATAASAAKASASALTDPAILAPVLAMARDTTSGGYW